MPKLKTVKAKKPKPDYAATVKLMCKAVGIKEPVAEYVFAPPRKWRFDFAWIDEGFVLRHGCRVALEIDGGLWSGGRHSRGSGIIKEHEKFNAAAADGWLIFRCTPQTLTDLAMWRQIKGVL